MSSSKASSSAAGVSTPNKNTSQTNSKQHQSSSNTAAGEYMLERLRILLNRLQSTTEILQNWPETQQGDSAKVHAESCTELISSIRKVVLGLRSVERHVNGSTGPSNNNNNTAKDNDDSSNKEVATPGGGGGSQIIQLSQLSKESLQSFRSSLDTKCPIPLDLLDLLDVGIQSSGSMKGNNNTTFGINPQVYVRGLMKESKRQLCGLERRKKSLNMLANCIEEGMKKDKVSSSGVLDDGVEKKEIVEKKKKSNVKRKRDGDDELNEEGETMKKIRAN